MPSNFRQHLKNSYTACDGCRFTRLVSCGEVARSTSRIKLHSAEFVYAEALVRVLDHAGARQPLQVARHVVGRNVDAAENNEYNLHVAHITNGSGLLETLR